MPDSSRIKAAAKETIINQTLQSSGLNIGFIFWVKKWQWSHSSTRVVNSRLDRLKGPHRPTAWFRTGPVKWTCRTCNNPHFYFFLSRRMWPRRPVRPVRRAAGTGEKLKALCGQAKSWYIWYCLSCQWLYLNIAYRAQPFWTVRWESEGSYSDDRRGILRVYSIDPRDC